MKNFIETIITAAVLIVIVIGTVELVSLSFGIVVSQIPPLPVEPYTVDIKPVSSLEVVNNYQEQKTANINVLEPKASDAYLQGAY